MEWECEECGHENISPTVWGEGVTCEKCQTEYETDWEEHWDGVDNWIVCRKEIEKLH